MGTSSIVEFKDEDINSIMKEMKEHPDVNDLSLTQMDDGGTLGTVQLQKCVACNMLDGSDCFMRSATSDGDGWIRWHLYAKDGPSLLKLVMDLKEVGCEVEVLKKIRIHSKDDLTDRQKEVLKTALRMGYYKTPRATTIRKIAERLNTAPSTIAEILQRSESKIISHHLLSSN